MLFYHKSSSDTKYHYWKNNIIFKDAYFYGNDDKVMGLDVTKEFGN